MPACIDTEATLASYPNLESLEFQWRDRLHSGREHSERWCVIPAVTAGGQLPGCLPSACSLCAGSPACMWQSLWCISGSTCCMGCHNREAGACASATMCVCVPAGPLPDALPWHDASLVTAKPRAALHATRLDTPHCFPEYECCWRTTKSLHATPAGRDVQLVLCAATACSSCPGMCYQDCVACCCRACCGCCACPDCSQTADPRSRSPLQHLRSVTLAEGHASILAAAQQLHCRLQAAVPCRDAGSSPLPRSCVTVAAGCRPGSWPALKSVPP